MSWIPPWIQVPKPPTPEEIAARLPPPVPQDPLDPGPVEPPPFIRPRDRAGVGDAPLGSDIGLPPPPGPPIAPPSYTPLALPGSFAQPGTRGAVPFRTPAYTQARVIGPTGPGAPIFGGIQGFSGMEPVNDDEEQLVRRIVAGLPTRR